MKKAKKVVKKLPPNKLFPGKRNYVGPQRGWFGFVHHGMLFEYSTEDMDNRVQYVKSMKPEDEKRTRLNHIIYLGKHLNAVIAKKNKGHHDNPARYDSGIKKAVLAYVKRHIKPLRWNGGSLCYPDGRSFTG